MLPLAVAIAVPARIKYHEAQRNGYQNVYLDAVDPAEEPGELGDGEVDEVAWRTATEAAPYLLGDRKRPIPPDDLYERLKPFKDLVAEDIREAATSRLDLCPRRKKSSTLSAR